MQCLKIDLNRIVPFSFGYGLRVVERIHCFPFMEGVRQMSTFEMKAQDLLELWQLLNLYKMTYDVSAEETVDMLAAEIRVRYSGHRNGEDILTAGNPRGAGRKKKYTEEHRKLVQKLRNEDGLTIRKIAQEAKCSVGYVEHVLRNQKEKACILIN